MIRMEIICSRVKRNQHRHRFMSGQYDIEIRDYVVLQKPQEQANRMPPPRTSILDFTLTHTRYG
jgi:hypothetical protein